MIVSPKTQIAPLDEFKPEELGRPSHGEIEALAYAIWEAQGCPEGSSEEDWLRAERELSESRG